MQASSLIQRAAASFEDGARARFEHLLAFALEPVALAAQHEHLRVVYEAVDESGDRHRVAEDLGPGGEGLVRADDDRAALVAARDEREEE